MPGPNSRILLETDDLRATLVDVDGGARPLVVTFDSLAHDLRLDRPGFGQGWLDAQGYDAVHVVSRLNTWYQLPEIAELGARVRALASGYARTVTYGSSMGGYAAIRFAGRMGAQGAIAISPQFSIDPRRAPFDQRWAEYARTLDFLWEEPDPRDAELKAAWVFYDPHDPDRLHVEALSALYPIVPVPLPHAGHPAGGLLLESGLLAPALHAAIAGELDAAQFARQVRAERRRSANYLSVLSRRQPASRRRTAARLAARAAQMQPDQPHLLIDQASWLESADRLDEAEAMYRRAMALLPEHPHYPLSLADFLARTGREAEAVRLVEDAGRRGFLRGADHARAAQVLFLAGRMPEALAQADRALEADAFTPGEARAVKLLRWLLRMGSPGRMALAAARRQRLRTLERKRRRRGEALRPAPHAPG